MLTARCEERLRGVDPRLVDVVRDAALRCPRKFIVVEGLRTIERQRELYAKGRTAPGLGPADYGEATLVIPQPFTPEAAAARVARLTPPVLQLIAT